jgi:hypothetical protein
MADIDSELSARLSLLAAAVPVSRGQLDPVHREAVLARERIRLAWLTPLVVLAIAVIAFGVVGFGQLGLSGVSSTRRDGDFELTLRADRARYAVGQQIELKASLTYVGSQPSIEIEHSQLAEDSPIAFGVEEPVLGGQFGTIDLLMAGRTTLKRGESLVVPFEEGAFGDGSNPRASEFQAYVEEPGFHLPAGTWHPYAEATFTTRNEAARGPASRSFRIRVRVEIVVDAQATMQSTPFANGPVTATAMEGEFELVIRSSRFRYAIGEPIEIVAGLAYMQPSGRVEIGHAMGARGSPLGFGVVEPVLGDLRLGPGWDLACVRTTIHGGIPVSQEFWKSSSWAEGDARGDEYHRYIVEPGLLLPAGTWHVFAVAEFSIGDCTAEPIKMRADITIEVREDHAPSIPATTEAPAMFPPENAGLESVSLSDTGDFWVEIHSDHRIYRESDPIVITAALQYLGDSAIDVSGFHPFGFSIREPVNGLSLNASVTTMECTSQRVLPGMKVEAPFRKSAIVSSLDQDYEAKLAYLNDPVLRLPPGSWHVAVNGSTILGQGCLFDGDLWSTELEFTVLPDAATRMDLLTGSFDAQPQCRSRVTSGLLARDDGTGVGIQLEDGRVHGILWPFGFSAWDTEAGAILVGEYGQVVATEGQHVSIRGMDEPGWLIRAGCINAMTRSDVVLP